VADAGFGERGEGSIRGQGPGAEPLVRVWVQSPQKLSDLCYYESEIQGLSDRLTCSTRVQVLDSSSTRVLFF